MKTLLIATTLIMISSATFASDYEDGALQGVYGQKDHLSKEECSKGNGNMNDKIAIQTAQNIVKDTDVTNGNGAVR